MKGMKTLFRFGLVLSLIVKLVNFSSIAADVHKTKVLLITGGHGFEREAFLKVFGDNPNVTLTHIPSDRAAAAIIGANRKVSIILRMRGLHESNRVTAV